jgi:hypothetical protein
MDDHWTGDEAVLIVRVWTEPQHSGGGFRARIVEITDEPGSGGADSPSVAVTSPQAVLDRVNAFLEAYQRGQPEHGNQSHGS